MATQKIFTKEADSREGKRIEIITTSLEKAKDIFALNFPTVEYTEVFEDDFSDSFDFCDFNKGEEIYAFLLK